VPVPSKHAVASGEALGKRVIPVGGPRHYPVKSCEERGFHRVRDDAEGFRKCVDCDASGDEAWNRVQFHKEADFLLEVGKAVDDLAKKQIREYGMLFDSENGFPRTAPHRGDEG
jgi:hypothetical protein